MECDWEVEIGDDAPVIDAAWEGFVDLRREPGRVEDLAEVAQLRALGRLLYRLSGPGSPVWTSKCDVWPSLEGVDFDADELDAPQGCANFASGCYVDIIPAAVGPRLILDQIVEAICQPWCARLRALDLRCCRVDLVVRRAIVRPLAAATERVPSEPAESNQNLGITAYVTACGATFADARETLGWAVTALANAVCPVSTLQ